MKLRELLETIDRKAKELKLPRTYACGGTPRDKVLGILTDINDLDLTNGTHSISKLALEVSNELKKQYSIEDKQMNDGHISLWLGRGKTTMKIDFSSNFLVPRIDDYLTQLGIEKVTPMIRELYSRDFTCNTLLMTLDLKVIRDLTHHGIEDINKRLLKTCLHPDITLRYNTNRIVRVPYLSAKLDFDIAPEIIEWIRDNKALLKHSSQQYVIKMLEKAIDKNPDRTVWMLNQTGLWDAIPITEKLFPYFQKHAQLRRNFDIGEGMYSKMNDGKIKSVDQFRKKRRKKQKQQIKKIKEMHLK